MTGKPKLPRLWDEKITTPTGRKVRRYVVHAFQVDSWANTRYTIYDKVHSQWLPNPARATYPKCYVFRTRSAAENWLKRTTVRSYELAMLNKALDRSA